MRNMVFGLAAMFLPLSSVSAESIDALMSENVSKISVYRSTNDSISSASIEKIEFDAEDFDTNDEFDSSSTYQFNPDRAGYYIVSVQAQIGAINQTDSTVLSLYKNNAEIANTISIGTNSTITHAITKIVYLDADDYLDVRIYHNNSNPRILYAPNTWMTIAELL